MGFGCLQLSFCLNPVALRTAKTLWSFGRSECNRVNETILYDAVLEIVRAPENWVNWDNYGIFP